jgi:hypothetical protein
MHSIDLGHGFGKKVSEETTKILWWSGTDEINILNDHRRSKQQRYDTKWPNDRDPHSENKLIDLLIYFLVINKS